MHTECSVMNSDVPLCRFCFEPEVESDTNCGLISPCDCLGSQRFVHSSCLKKWQMTVMVASTTGGRLSSSEQRVTHCSVCGAPFRGVDIPGRATLMESFCGTQALSHLQRGSFLIASRASSARTVRRNLPPVLEALFELKLSHWRRSVYFIYEFTDCGDGNGDETVRAVNLTRLQCGSVDQPIPDEVLVEMDDGQVAIRHHNGGPVKWSSHRSCLCCLDMSPDILRTFLPLCSVSADRSEDPSVSSLQMFTVPLHGQASSPPAQSERTLLLGTFGEVMSLLRCDAVRGHLAGQSEWQGGEAGTHSTASDISYEGGGRRGDANVVRLFSFSGYAQWTRAQLLAEVSRGSWRLLGAHQVRYVVV